MIIVPQEISQKAFYSIPIFVVCYIVFKYLQYEYAEILLLLALTSYLHWRKVMKISIVKILDIITSVSTIVLVTIYSSKKRFNVRERVRCRRFFLLNQYKEINTSISIKGYKNGN